MPEVETVTEPERSVAVAPASVYEAPSSTLSGLAPVTVTTGLVVSTTLTVLEAVPVLPELSVAVYVIVYEPTWPVFTEPDALTVSPVSALAPGSVNVPPNSTVIEAFPVRVMTGGVLSSSSSRTSAKTAAEATVRSNF